MWDYLIKQEKKGTYSILIIEDDMQLLCLYANLFLESGYRVHTTTNGKMLD